MYTGRLINLYRERFEEYGGEETREMFDGELNYESGKLFFLLFVATVYWLPYIPYDLELHRYPALAVGVRVTFSLISAVLILLRFTKRFKSRPGILLMAMVTSHYALTAVVTGTAGVYAPEYISGMTFVLLLPIFVPFPAKWKYALSILSVSVFFIAGALTGLNFSEPSVRYALHDMLVSFCMSFILIYALDGLRRKKWMRRSELGVMIAQNRQNLNTISVIAEMVECRDEITGGHIERTQKYLTILVNELLRAGVYSETISGWDMELLLSSAQLHDVGKIVVSDAILNKPGKLTEEEFELIKRHCVEGERVIDRIITKTKYNGFLLHARRFAGCHHEWWDGAGYPRNLRGEEIPLEGRIMAVADVYDALVSERPYKKPFSHERAVEIISGNRSIQFDPKIVDAFMRVSDEIGRQLQMCIYIDGPPLELLGEP